MIAQANYQPGGRRSLSFRYKLVPREPCVLRAPPARLLCALPEEERPLGQSQGCFYNHFFETTGEGDALEEIYLAAPVPEILVSDLAETGRSAHFADIVGPCDLRTSVAPARVEAIPPDGSARRGIGWEELSRRPSHSLRRRIDGRFRDESATRAECGLRPDRRSPSTL